MRNLAQLLGQQHWTPIRNRPGWEQREFLYQARDWSHARFFLAVRCLQDNDDDHPQVELLEITRYDFYCYVTTEPLSPWLAHRTQHLHARVWEDWLALSQPL